MKTSEPAIEKEWYREKILEMVRTIENVDRLYSISIFISDILKEDREDEKQKIR